MEAQPPASAVGPAPPGTAFWANGVVNLFNVLFFVIVQTVFFMLIASREMDRVVAGKTKVLSSLRRELVASGQHRGVQALDHTMYEQRRRVREQNVDRARDTRTAGNWMLAFSWILPVVAALVLALVCFAVLARRSGRGFSYAHRVGLGLVVFAYVTEVLFFLFVVNRYRLVGDWEAVQMACGLDDEDTGNK